MDFRKEIKNTMKKDIATFLLFILLIICYLLSAKTAEKQDCSEEVTFTTSSSTTTIAKDTTVTTTKATTLNTTTTKAATTEPLETEIPVAEIVIPVMVATETILYCEPEQVISEEVSFMETTIEEATSKIETSVEINIESDIEAEVSDIGITDYEKILLANIVANEYGSDWISVEEKAKVVNVVMNRVYSGDFPNTIYEVLSQPYQFAFDWRNTYNSRCTQSCIDAVEYYFANSSKFDNSMYFYGDGYKNYFY